MAEKDNDNNALAHSPASHIPRIYSAPTVGSQSRHQYYTGNVYVFVGVVSGYYRIVATVVYYRNITAVP